MVQRSLGVFLMLLLGAVWASAPGQSGGHHINIVDTTMSAYNREVSGLLTWVYFFAIIVFVVVTGALIYVVVKFRRTGNETSEPVQTHGNDPLEVTWTIIPTVIVLIIFGLTARSMFALDRPATNPMVIEVHGWQFWWDFKYKEQGIRNSNELIIPVGKPVTFEITGGADKDNYDVIHSFRIASLVGTQDAIPGVTTYITITPEKVGDYYGQCVELCGASHSNMRFRVKVVEQAEFDKWIAGAQAFSAATPTDPQLAKGAELFKNNCVACHALKGVSEANAGNIRNPDLTFLGNRTTVGGGIWDNKPEYLEAWIKNSPGMKPGSKMPPFPQLSDDDVKAIAAYLNSNKVEGLELGSLPKF